MYSGSKSYGNFPDTISTWKRHVHPSPAADRSAEMVRAPGMGLVGKALVFELFRVNLFIVIVTDEGVAAQRA